MKLKYFIVLFVLLSCNKMNLPVAGIESYIPENSKVILNLIILPIKRTQNNIDRSIVTNEGVHISTGALSVHQVVHRPTPEHSECAK